MKSFRKFDITQFTCYVSTEQHDTSSQFLASPIVFTSLWLLFPDNFFFPFRSCLWFCHVGTSRVGCSGYMCSFLLSIIVVLVLCVCFVVLPGIILNLSQPYMRLFRFWIMSHTILKLKWAFKWFVSSRKYLTVLLCFILNSSVIS